MQNQQIKKFEESKTPPLKGQHKIPAYEPHLQFICFAFSNYAKLYRIKRRTRTDIASTCIALHDVCIPRFRMERTRTDYIRNEMHT